ncbi:MAG: membrane dipeptidase [Oscillospiraceae bacterium]|nr:membrane dipeptidase [Oscillospiraceae bacterium]
MNFPVFDLHCDTLSAIIDENLKLNSLYKNTGHIDLERAKLFPGYAQCFACFATTCDCQNPIEQFERQLAAFQKSLDNNANFIRQAYCCDDIERNLMEGICSAILTIEGPAGFGYDPALLEDLYKIGVRITTLGWNEQNPLTGSHITGGGLTELGCEYVKEAQRLGILVDVSHISDEGFWDIMDITDAPIIASHSNSRSIWNVSRNITDDMFLEICKTGGVAGINLYAEFLGKDPDLDTVCDHIFHFINLDNTGEHIALGGDLDGCDTLPRGFDGVQSYPLLADKLLSRGLDEKSIYNIFWNNAVGVMRKCCT